LTRARPGRSESRPEGAALKNRRNQYFTVTLTPERTGKTRYFVIRRRGLKALALGLVLIVAGGMALSVAGLRGWWQDRQARAGADRSAALSAALRIAEDKMETVAARLEQVNAFEDRLRELAQLSDPARQLAIGPVGADDNDSESPWDGREHPLMRQARQALIGERMAGLLEEANHQVARLQGLARHFEAMQARLAATPALRPTKGWLTSRFGERRDPMTGRAMMHRGIDIAASIGTPIVSPADGAVVKVEEQTGYGLVVIVDHGFGMMTKYAHLADTSVRAGDTVRRGEKIGGVGMSGRSTGPHLHYEVMVDGIAADPEYFILD
jgi:murein DD-endopeptidase MepM/ murein hydrolase activator NlpD